MATAELTYEDKRVSLPVITGTEGEIAVDISKLRAQTGMITLDPGYMNTGSCESDITFIDGEKGILRYRGYNIEEVCEKTDFLEVAYLLINGHLPSQSNYDQFLAEVYSHANVHQGIYRLIETFPTKCHPMPMLCAAVSSLSSYYPYNTSSPEETRGAMIRLMGALPVIAANIFRHLEGMPHTYTKKGLSYSANFIDLMFRDANGELSQDLDLIKALDMLLILHADHEQNCSTASVRMVGSSGVNIYAAISAGISALWGPLHGGANQAVLEMLAAIHKDGGDVDKFINLAKDKDSGFRLMGFGHRVYKNFDPRARILKKHCDIVLHKLGVKDPLLGIARKLEEAALHDPYFVDRKLYPNVDFYSGIIYKAMGIPVDMFTVMFALGRLPGWISQWNEFQHDPTRKIGRPRQIYQGPEQRPLVSPVDSHH